jgi:hypothetical protein
MYITRRGAEGLESSKQHKLREGVGSQSVSIAESSLTEAFLICKNLHELNIVNIISCSYHKCSLSPNTFDKPRVGTDSQCSHRPMVQHDQKVRPRKRLVYFEVTA